MNNNLAERKFANTEGYGKASMFVGPEIEKTKFYGDKTVIVVHPNVSAREIIKTAKARNCSHVLLGFVANKPASYIEMCNLALELITEGHLAVTLEVDATDITKFEAAYLSNLHLVGPLNNRVHILLNIPTSLRNLSVKCAPEWEQFEGVYTVSPDKFFHKDNLTRWEEYNVDEKIL